jgi:hypothetical protein
MYTDAHTHSGSRSIKKEIALNLAMMFVVPGNLSTRYFHLLLQGNEHLKLHIYVTMTASVLIRDVHKISKRDY